MPVIKERWIHTAEEISVSPYMVVGRQHSLKTIGTWASERFFPGGGYGNFPGGSQTWIILLEFSKSRGALTPAPPSDAHELVHNVFHYWVLSVATQRSYFLSKTCVHQRAKVNSLSVIY